VVFNNRVLYVKLPCPSVLTSYSKVHSDIENLTKFSRRLQRLLPEGGISGVLRTRPMGDLRKAREGRDYLREASVFWDRLVGPRC
jgi:hypothetical protein